ncbi:MAG: methyltransferase domain-containing protein [Pseudomonadota bacterium]
MNDMIRQQAWQPKDYAANARFVSDLAGAVLEWLDLKPGERILDLGCGDGALTLKLSEMGAHVVGVDASENFVEAAKGQGVDARLMNGEALTFSEEFDAVFSNAALHWMTNPSAVIEGIARALKPKGRFVAEFGGFGNVAAIATALRAVAHVRGGDESLVAPWFFPSPEEYTDLLTAQGFVVDRIGLYPRPTPLKTGMGPWLKTFRTPFFEQYGDAADAVLDDVVALLKPALRDAQGNWMADYVRLRVEAHLG